jgi:HEAT repeat protein/S1-C subfamily serine protease
MLRFSCPNPKCDATIEIPESKAGGVMSCPECRQRMQAPDAPAGGKNSPADDVEEVEEIDEVDEVQDMDDVDEIDHVEEVEETSKPSKKKSAAIRSTPPARKRPVARDTSDDDEDDDDDDDDDDRPKKRSKKSSSNLALVLGALGVFLLLILGGGGFAAYKFLKKDDKVAGGSPSPQSSVTSSAITPPDNVPSSSNPVSGLSSSAPPGNSSAHLSSSGTPPGGSSGTPYGSSSATPQSGGSDGSKSSAILTNDPSDPLRPRPNQSGNAGERVYERLLKSTVMIRTRVPGGEMMGSGFLIDAKNRLVVTNLHVVDQSSSVVVYFPFYYPDGKMETNRERFLRTMKSLEKPVCKVLATDNKRDLAVIQLAKLPDGVLPLRMAADEPKPGADVHSVGNAGASDGVFVYTSGKVKQVYNNEWLVGTEDRRRAPYHFKAKIVETQSPTNPGDSGGPLVNNSGDIVGVTEGGASEANSVSIFISTGEVRAFLENVLPKQNPPIMWQPETEGGGLDDAGSSFTVDSLPGLERVLKDDAAPQRRAEAARAIGTIGIQARSAIPNLLEAIKDSDRNVSTAAMEALGKLGSASDVVLPELISKSLNDSDKRVKLYAARAIGKMGAAGVSAIDPLIELTRDNDPELHNEALLALGRVGAGNREKVFPILFGQLKDAKDKPTRTLLAEAISHLGEPTVNEIASLRENLEHPSSEMRVYCTHALGQLGSLSKDAVPVLTKILKHEDKPTAIAAADALGKIGADAKTAIPALLEALQDNNHALSKASTEALVLIAGLTKTEGGFAKADIAILAGALKNSHAHVKTGALAVLGILGQDAKDAIPQLGLALKDPDKSIRIQAAQALEKFAPAEKGPLPSLIETLKEKDQDTELRVVVIHALGQYGTQAKDAIGPLDDILLKAYKDKLAVELLVILEAISALGNMQAGKDVGNHMLDLVQGEDSKPLLIPTISRALGKMGPVVIPCVERLLISKDAGARYFGAKAIIDMSQDLKDPKTAAGLNLKQKLIAALEKLVTAETNPRTKKALEDALDKVKGAV